MTDVLEPRTDPSAVDVSETEGMSEKPESFTTQAWKRFRSHKLAMIGILMLILLVAAFYLGPLLQSDEDFAARSIPDRDQGPSADHWFGTDDIGRDLFVRTMIGGRTSLQIAFITAAVTTVLAAILGGVAGYFGGIFDSIITFLTNLLLTIPVLAILLVVGIRFGAEPLQVAILIGLLGWVRGARVVRAQVFKFKEMEFVQAAKAAGAGSNRIMLRHIMPNVAGSLFVEATLVAGTAIILESTLSFLSLGVQPPDATLGTLIADAKGSLDTRPSRVLIPGGILTLFVLSINFIGDGLRDALDPTSTVGRK